MRIKLITASVKKRVEFPDADNIDRTRLAEKLGVSVAMVSRMIRTGQVPARFIPMLKEIPLSQVKTLRKPTGK